MVAKVSSGLASEGQPVHGRVIAMITPTMAPAFEIGEAQTDSTGHYAMYLQPPAQ